MHIVKLPWFGHNTSNARVGCYSVAMSPDGSRLASGGLDGNVKIWNPKLATQFARCSANDNKHKTLPQKSLKDDRKNPLVPIDSNEMASTPAELSESHNGPDLPHINKLLNTNNHNVNSPEFETRALGTMNRHNGAVTCVKFCPNGRFLASGSDDKIILIWEKDGDGPRPKQFGDTEADLEHWTVRKRLVAHENDVQDIAWLPDGALLVTVGLDRLIIIWSGTTFERVKRYDVHQLMVKGVVFDPANKFFATASDDRTVRIFRYYRPHPLLSEHEFQMEHLVVDPFKKSPLTSYFRRMSWLPDGQHIAVPNATNGPVTSVAIINRGLWGTDISLIGHEAPCEVCLFSPRLYKTEQDSKSEFVTVVASAGQDLSLAVWSTAVSQPLVVAQNIVEDAITDLCWSPAGDTLFASSLDGSITCVVFDKDELGYLADKETNDVQLNRYGTDRESAVFAESVEQLQLEEMDNKESGSNIGIIRSASALPSMTSSISSTTQLAASSSLSPSTPLSTISKSSPVVSSSTSKVSTAKLRAAVTITKDGKKRVTPLLVSAVKPTIAPLAPSAAKNSSNRELMAQKISQVPYSFPRVGISTSVHGLKSRADQNTNFARTEAANEMDNDNDNDDMMIMDEALDGASAGLISGITLGKQKARVRRTMMEERYPSYFRLVSNLPEVLFHHRGVVTEQLSRYAKADGFIDGTLPSSFDVDEGTLFSVLLSQATIVDKQSGSMETINVEVRNGAAWTAPAGEETGLVYSNDGVDFQDPTLVFVSSNIQKSRRNYCLYFPYKVQLVAPVVVGLGDQQRAYFAFASFTGSLQLVDAASGSFAAPTIEVGSNVVVLRQQGPYLLCVTNNGLIYLWRLPSAGSRTRIEAVVYAVSLATIWNRQLGYRGPDVEKVPVDTSEKAIGAIELDQNGSPYVHFTGSEEIYHYSTDLQCWTRLNDPWYYLAYDDGDSVDFGPNIAAAALQHQSWRATRSQIVRGIRVRYVGLYPELKASMRLRQLEMST